MPEHDRFEELCALALVGQISPEDSAELQAHLRECATCRAIQADFVEIESMWLTPATEPEVLGCDAGPTLSQRVLCKMQAAGARFSKPVLKEVGGRSPGFSLLVFKSPYSPAYAAAALVMLAAGSLLGFGVASRYASPSPPEKVAVFVPGPVGAQSLPQTAQPSSLAPPQQVTASPIQDDLTQKLAAAEAERVRTQAQLEDAERRLNAVQNANAQSAGEVASLKAVAEQARTEAANAQTQLAKLKDTQATQTADLVAATYRAREAEEKLAEQVASLERERQLLGAGREIRDIVGARNLHIIDVADVGNGGVKKPFGRMFYTEGKSLIFYAYDLTKPKAKQAFYAWGHREGDPESTHALGILFNDDQAQKRWSLKFSDPKVLAEIDSVFVTLEPSDQPGDAPKGKRLLKAYLGTPANHP